MSKPNVYPLSFPLEINACARQQALIATVDALGVNDMTSTKFKMLYVFNRDRISAQFAGVKS